MKKSVLFITAALCFGAAGAQAPIATTVAQAPALTDVPAGHWAKDAVERLVNEGIILGYPDGTYRGTQTLTRYEAAMIINRLLDRMGSGDVDMGAIDDATMVALRNAINELSAQGADFEVRLAELEASAVSQEDFARLEGRVDALATTGTDNTDVADQLATVNEMATLLNQDVLHLQDQVATVEGDLATFDARLGLVEDQVTDNTAVISEQGLRIADLENGRVSLTLGLGAGYGNLSLSEGDTAFDVDRVTNSTFAAKEFSDTDNEGKTSKVDVNKNISSQDELLGLTLGVKATDINAGNGIVIEEAGVNFGFAPATLTRSESLTGVKGKTDDVYAVTLEKAGVTGRVGDDVRFRAIGSPGNLALRPDAFNAVSDLDDVPGYNDYLLPNGGRNGIAAGVTLTDVPLKPTLYLAGGVGDKDTLNGTYFALRSESKLGDNGLAALSFVQNNAQYEVDNATGKLNLENAGRTAVGAELAYEFGEEEAPVHFGAEALYTASFPSDFFFADQYGQGDLKDYLATRQQAAILKAKADVDTFGAEVKADLVARAVSPGYAEGVAGLDRKGKTPDYTNEVGLGGRVQADFGAFNVGAYGDTFVPYYERTASSEAYYANAPYYLAAADEVAIPYDTATNDFFARRSSFGAQAGAGVGGFQITPFYRRTTLGDRIVRYNDEHIDFGEVKRGDVMKAGETDKLFMATSSVGAALTHDGSSDMAVVPNLDLTIADAYFYNEEANNFVALAEYDAKVIDGVKLTPFLGYSLLSQQQNPGTNLVKPNAKLDTLENFSILKYGLGVETEELNLAFKPKFEASVVNAQYDANFRADAAGYTMPAYQGSELAANAAVTLKDILGPSAEVSLGYGFHQGNNLGYNADNRLGSASQDPQKFGFGGTAYAPSSLVSGAFGREKALSTRTQGVFTQLKWNEALRVNYGIFFYDEDLDSANNETNIAQGFKINYGVKF